MGSKWGDYYKKRLISMEEVGKKIQSNWSLYMSMGTTSNSPALYESIYRNCHRLENVSINEGFVFSDNVFQKLENNVDVYEKIKLGTGYASGASRTLFKHKLRDILIHHAGDINLWANITDCWILMTTPPNNQGFVNLSLSNVGNRNAIHLGKKSGKCKMVIAEVNDRLPVIYGDNWMHVNEIDYFVEHSMDPPEFCQEVSQPSEQEIAIADYVASMIDDGNTIQIGIGQVPEIVCKSLDGKKDLGILSDLFLNTMLDLVEKGIVTNVNKPVYPGVSICSIVLGDKKLYDYCTEEMSIQIHPAIKLLDPNFIAKHTGIVTINNSLMIDLTGQVTCEGIGHRQISGVGGQFGYQVGAMQAENGKAIQIIRSTVRAEDGSMQSSIVNDLPSGTPVSVPRFFVDNIITEFGVANLRYKTARQRADALIAIAHPDFRGELRKAARNNLYPEFDQTWS